MRWQTADCHRDLQSPRQPSPSKADLAVDYDSAPMEEPACGAAFRDLDEMNTYSNTPWDALEIGMEASAKRLCRAEDFLVYASSSGNHNPVHLPKGDHDGDGKADEPIAPSMWVASLISAVLGNQLPGPGTLYKGQNLRFLGRAHAGDELTVTIRLAEKKPELLAVFATTVTKADGAPIVEGTFTPSRL